MRDSKNPTWVLILGKTLPHWHEAVGVHYSSFIKLLNEK